MHAYLFLCACHVCTNITYTCHRLFSAAEVMAVFWGPDHIFKIGGLPKLMPLDIDFQESCPTSATTKINTHTCACTVAGWAGGFRMHFLTFVVINNRKSVVAITNGGLCLWSGGWAELVPTPGTLLVSPALQADGLAGRFKCFAGGCPPPLIDLSNG